MEIKKPAGTGDCRHPEETNPCGILSLPGAGA